MQMPGELGTFHILGIGGIGMSAIAEILRAKGYTVQGSDQKESANVKRLRTKGIRVFVGHDPVNLVGARLVVISTAVKPGNPELEAARAKGIPIIRRAEILAELMRLYSSISVTGTHGKTTTTSLIAHVLKDTGLEPTVITGGIINDWGSNARLGAGPWMVVEADESDGTFIKIPTQIGVVTNIDPEHLDYFRSVENMHREYETFFRNIPFYGLAVTCTDHPVAREMIERLNLRRDGRRLLTYGTTPTRTCGSIMCASMAATRSSMPRSGSVWSAGGKRRLEGWRGAGARASTTRSMRWRPSPSAPRRASPTRRSASCSPASPASSAASSRPALERRRDLRRLRPSPGRDRGGPEGRARRLQGPRHRCRRAASLSRRVRDLFADFSAMLSRCDAVIVAPLYSAGEAPIDGIISRSLAEAIRRAGHAGSVTRRQRA